MRLLSLVTTLGLVSCAFAPIASAQPRAAQPSPPPAVKVGEAAPDFTLPYLVPKDGGGFEAKQVRLSDYQGKQNVVVAFFPAAFSPGCTSEMQAYQKNTGEFNATNTVVVGVSVDSTWANKAFREQLDAEFPILSDWKKETTRAYGVLNDETGFARRTTFVIDTKGIVQHIDQDQSALDPMSALAICRLAKK